MKRWRWAGVAATLVAGALVVPATAGAGTGTVVGQGRPDKIPGQYLVTFNNTEVQQSQVDEKADELADKYRGKVGHLWRYALRGFSVKLSDAQAQKLASETSVARVEQDAAVHGADVQPNPPNWGVDRIDQRDLPLDSSYTYPAHGGQGATVYVIDSGLRKTHEDFGTRASHGPDYVDNDNDSSDCHGHGTHVAGSAVGAKYGVAKKANVVGVRVLNCSNQGSFSGIISGVDWVTANAQKPAVANMSLGGGGSNSTLETAVKNLIAKGVPVAVAAMNYGADACGYTPALVPEVITVGNANKTDARHSGAGASNYGACLDIWGPGTSVLSAGKDSDTATATMTGTSMATPHVAGVVALYQSVNPSATPEQVRAALVDNATKDKLTDIRTGSPNLLLYMGFLNGVDPDPDPDPVPSPLTNGGFEAGDLSGWTAGGTARVTSVVSAGAHEGTRAVRLGASTETNGESTVSQTFTAPSGSARLSVWYSMTCPDTVTYAWARVVLKDNDTGATSYPLAKTCTNGQGWQQVTAPLTAGHSYTLTLVNRDDNHPDDPVSTLFDDVSVG